MGTPDQKHGLAWAKGQKPNPGPTWCAKKRPCDFDRATAYCPHRECRQRLVDEHEYLAGKLSEQGSV